MDIVSSFLQIFRCLAFLSAATLVQGCMDTSLQSEKCEKIVDGELQDDILSSISNHFGATRGQSDHVSLLDASYKNRRVTYVDCGKYYVVENEPFDPREGFFAVGVTEVFKLNKKTMDVVSFKEV